MKQAAAIALALVVSGWTVTHQRDPMTDKTLTWASASSGEATLLVGCMNGTASPRLTFGRRIGWGNVGVSWRVDDGPVVPRMAMVAQTGDAIYLDGLQLRGARRLRANVGSAFFDFDLVKGSELPTRWGC